MRITLPLSEAMLADMDAARAEGETRVDFIRVALHKEMRKLKRRRAREQKARAWPGDGQFAEIDTARQLDETTRHGGEGVL
ncbi:hypothetical protein [Phyllobacterium pellucidum]|uniref:hypothetical protein n=1 Tax=Phyllobacterium pellucidum TaxID=2740464 RepID=UPI001D15DE7C|nr:hypothetical protein [Phyllobacterium sp. T1018]UGY08593.1 hypothetical protein LLE51_011110 [Phyllobacterium sp. T1018]